MSVGEPYPVEAVDGFMVGGHYAPNWNRVK